MVAEIETARLKTTLVADVERFKAAMDGARVKVEETQRAINKDGKVTTETTSKMSASFDQYGRNVQATRSPIDVFVNGLGRIFPQARGVFQQIQQTAGGTEKATQGFQANTRAQGPMQSSLGKSQQGFAGTGKSAGGAAGGMMAVAAAAAIVIQKMMDVAKAIISVIFNFIRQTQVFQFGVSILRSFVDFILGVFLRAFVEGLQGGSDAAGGAFKQFSETVKELARAFVDLAPKVVELITLAIPLVSAILVVVTAIVRWISEGDRLKILMALLIAVLIVLAAPIIILVGLILGLILVIETWIKVFHAIYDVLHGVWDFLANTFGPVLQTLWDGIKSIADLVSGFFSTVWNNIVDVFNGVKTPFQALVDIGHALWDTLSSVAGIVGGIFSSVWQAITSVLDTVWDVLSGIWDALSGMFPILNQIANVVGGALTWAWQGITGTLQTIWNILSGIWDTLVGIGNAISNAAGGAGQAIGDFFDWLNPFEAGGPVYGTGPALLHSGEFVLPAGSAEGIARLLQFYGGGGGGGGAGPTNVAPVINVSIYTSGVTEGLFSTGQAVAREIESAIRGATS